MGVPVDDHVSAVEGKQPIGRQTTQLVPVGHENFDLAGAERQPRFQGRACGIGVAVDRPDGRDRAKLVQHSPATHVPRMQDLRDPPQRLEHPRSDEPVGVRHEPDYDGVVSLCDAHCHFFSSRFLELLTEGVPGLPDTGRSTAVSHRLGWTDPGSAEDLADRWVGELDGHGVDRAALIASLPGDEASVATAVARHPARFVGFFMFNPARGDVRARLEHAVRGQGLRGICLFPAMHGYRLDDDGVRDVFAAAADLGAVVFAHCGVLSVGVRKKLGLLSAFDFRLGDPLALAATAVRFPSVPVIVPHFGAGFFRELLMAADQCQTIHIDTSSSNGWLKYHPGLTLETVFRQTLAVVGAGRVVFGTDSSFFPRGWQQPIHDAQRAAVRAASLSDADQARIFGGNFQQMFG